MSLKVFKLWKGKGDEAILGEKMGYNEDGLR